VVVPQKRDCVRDWAVPGQVAAKPFKQTRKG
jgi:hypothetical protein